jgi:hypothetical protein
VEINAAAHVVNNTHPRFVFLFSILPTFDTMIPKKRALSFCRTSSRFNPSIRKEHGNRRNPDRELDVMKLI